MFPKLRRRARSAWPPPRVAKTEPGVKGDRVSGAMKPARLETGITVQVPLFVEEGDRVKVDTRTGDYLTREK